MRALGRGRRAAGDLVSVPAPDLAPGSGARRFDGCCRSSQRAAAVQSSNGAGEDVQMIMERHVVNRVK